MTGYDDIAACAAAYLIAKDASRDLADMAVVEALLEARVVLADCLLAAGWTPAPEVNAALTTDRGLLLQYSGTVEHLQGAVGGAF